VTNITLNINILNRTIATNNFVFKATRNYKKDKMNYNELQHLYRGLYLIFDVFTAW